MDRSRTPRSRRRWRGARPTAAAWLVVAWLVPACGGGGGGDGSPITGPRPDPTPAPVPAEVTVLPELGFVHIGETTDFVATVLDADGEPLAGLDVRWEVSNAAIATIDDAGRVTGLAPGDGTVRARAGEVVGTASLAVRPRVDITAIEPATFEAGRRARVTGTGFLEAAGEISVSIGGVRAPIVDHTTTTIDFVVPEACRPTGPADVQVRVGTTLSPLVEHAYRRTGAPFEPAVGELTILRGADAHCLRFDAESADEAYLIGLQSTAGTPTSLTPFALVSVTDEAVAGGLAPAWRTTPPGGRGLGAADAGRDAWLRRHREGEARLRAAERRVVASRRLAPAAPVRRLAPAQIPAVGDRFPVRVPRRSDICGEFVEIEVVVRHVGTEGIWVEDVENPSAFRDETYRRLSEDFDRRVIGVLDDAYGRPTDLDGNGRVVVVTTKEMNAELADSGVLAFVVSSDFASRETCPASNEGEYYYTVSPDPAGAVGPVLSRAVSEDRALTLVAHEVTHVIQFGRRFLALGAMDFPTPWELEGQATFSEEIVGHAFGGHAERANLGPDVVFDSSAGPNWYVSAFSDLVAYFGWAGGVQRTIGAPEMCSFLDAPGSGPCINRPHYGVTWSFLRYLVDRFAGGFPGAPEGLHRAIIEGPGRGFEKIERVTGRPIHELLAGWAATLYVDDRIPGLDPALDFPSWDLFAIDRAFEPFFRLQPARRAFASFEDELVVRAASSAYFVVEGPRPEAGIRVASPSQAPLPSTAQVWVVRLR